jgi:hypothetical protein
MTAVEVPVFELGSMERIGKDAARQEEVMRDKARGTRRLPRFMEGVLLIGTRDQPHIRGGK